MEEDVLWTHNTDTLQAKVVRLNNGDAQLVVKRNGEIAHDSTTALTNKSAKGIALEDVMAWKKIISELQ
jgi:hypothetical protein